MPSATNFKKIAIRSFVLAGILFSLAGVLYAQPGMAQADIKKSLCTGITDTTGGPADCAEDTTTNVKSLAIRIIDIFSWVVGVLAVIMLIVGGFRYIVSGGDSNGISGAKNTIIYALVGLVIVIFAQTIVKFVVTNITKDQASSSSSSRGAGGTSGNTSGSATTSTASGGGNASGSTASGGVGPGGGAP